MDPRSVYAIALPVNAHFNLSQRHRAKCNYNTNLGAMILVVNTTYDASMHTARVI